MSTTGGRAGSRVAVLGDIGGHLEELRRELRRLGADPDSGRLPADLTVIQVGDLVHRGPDSAGVVALVDGYLTSQPDQWIQLVGNHEAQYLREPAFEWAERLDDRSVDTLRRWWADGQMAVAAAVVRSSESFLITHAGLTEAFWRDVLGAPQQVAPAADALNSLIGAYDAVLFRPGHMLGGGRGDRLAGPIWAATATELVPGWLDRPPLPFSQVHGHASLYDWHRGVVKASRQIAQVTVIDEDARHETVSLTGGRIIGVDPGHGRRPARRWRAWETGRD